jgi:hypothetical protein
LAIDPIGTFWLALRDSEGIFRKEKFRGDPAFCVHRAEQFIEREFGGVMNLVSREAHWKTAPATEKQVKFLVDRGIDRDEAVDMTKGQASRFIGLLQLVRS